MNQPGKNIPFEDVQRQMEKLALLETENKRLEQENRLLREKVDYILRRMFGSSSEKLHPGQLELMLSLQEEAQTAGKGESSTFSLELPPYRPPNLLRTLHTSLVDRTMIVLWRAVVFAVPAGAVIWLVANVSVSSHSLAWWAIGALDPLAWVMGLTGVILFAYVIAIPANEIVVPTILMLTVLVSGTPVADAPGAGVMFEADDSTLHTMLVSAGWTTLTAVCLMLFSLLHNPCSTTLYTIQKETGDWRWTTLSAALPLALGFIVCSSVAFAWRYLAG